MERLQEQKEKISYSTMEYADVSKLASEPISKFNHIDDKVSADLVRNLGRAAGFY